MRANREGGRLKQNDLAATGNMPSVKTISDQLQLLVYKSTPQCSTSVQHGLLLVSPLPSPPPSTSQRLQSALLTMRMRSKPLSCTFLTASSPPAAASTTDPVRCSRLSASWRTVGLAWLITRKERGWGRRGGGEVVRTGRQQTTREEMTWKGMT